MKKFTLILFCFLLGCTYGHTITPLPENRYNVTVKSQGYAKVIHSDQGERLHKLSSTICPDYKVVYKDWTHDWWWGFDFDTWIIQCP